MTGWLSESVNTLVVGERARGGGIRETTNRARVRDKIGEGFLKDTYNKHMNLEKQFLQWIPSQNKGANLTIKSNKKKCSIVVTNSFVLYCTQNYTETQELAT